MSGGRKWRHLIFSRDCQGLQKDECISRFPNTREALGSTVGKVIRGRTEVCMFPEASDSGEERQETVRAESMLEFLKMR